MSRAGPWCSFRIKPTPMLLRANIKSDNRFLFRPKRPKMYSRAFLEYRSGPTRTPAPHSTGSCLIITSQAMVSGLFFVGSKPKIFSCIITSPAIPMVYQTGRKFAVNPQPRQMVREIASSSNPDHPVSITGGSPCDPTNENFSRNLFSPRKNPGIDVASKDGEELILSHKNTPTAARRLRHFLGKWFTHSPKIKNCLDALADALSLSQSGHIWRACQCH